jgi:hypothetical protein
MITFRRLRLWLAGRIRPEAAPPAEEEPSEVDRGLHTLDRWRRLFTDLPRTIDCPSMELIVRDHEDPIFLGSGRIVIESETSISFFINGVAPDIGRAIEAFNEARENPFDHLRQFRLFATDYRQTRWTCGYTELRFFTDHDTGWPLSGKLNGLSTSVSGYWVSKVSGVELLLVPPIDLPTTEALTQEARIGNRTIYTSRGPGRHELEIAGSSIAFSYEPSGEALWVTATTSDALNHPYLEHWLTEPLRILLGGAVYPRMMARNFGDGTAQVTLVPAPTFRTPTAFGLHPPYVMSENRYQSFWQYYADILTMLARDRLFDTHPLTAYFDEVAQAARGTRWVLTMTLASTIEALAGRLMTKADKTSEYPEETLDALKQHILEWKGDDTLRGRVLNSLGMIRKRSILRYLRDLADRGALDTIHVQAWYEVRNAVMHGTLVEPWSTEEGERTLNAMLKLMHALAHLVITRASAGDDPEATCSDADPGTGETPTAAAG